MWSTSEEGGESSAQKALEESDTPAIVAVEQYLAVLYEACLHAEARELAMPVLEEGTQDDVTTKEGEEQKEEDGQVVEEKEGDEQAMAAGARRIATLAGEWASLCARPSRAYSHPLPTHSPTHTRLLPRFSPL